MTGWPWPLDAVQEWFEGLWNSINEWINQGVNWLWDQISTGISNLSSSISQFFTNLWQNISNLLTTISNTITQAISNLWNDILSNLSSITKTIVETFISIIRAISALISTLEQNITSAISDIGNSIITYITSIPEAITNAFNSLWNHIQNIGSTIGEHLTNIGNQITQTGTWIYNNIKTAFDGALGSISEALYSIFKPIIDPILTLITWVQDAAKAFNPMNIINQVAAMLNTLTTTITEFLAHHSPITPEEALDFGLELREKADTEIHAWYQGGLWAEALSLGQMDMSFGNLSNVPKFAAYRDTAIKLYQIEMENALLTPYEQKVKQIYTPELPSASDLVRMVVREAFVPEMITPAPDEFAHYMEYQGYSRFWSDKYWTAHWVPAALTDAREAVYRGLITEQDYIDLLRIHDIHPKYRGWLAQTIYRVLRLIDIRRGWELGVLSDADMEHELRKYGYHPADVPKVAAIHKAIALAGEISTLRSEAIKDYTEGLIDKTTLIDRLKQAGTPEATIEYYIKKAEYAMRRDMLLEQIHLLRDAAIRGIITIEDLRSYLYQLGVQTWKVDQIISYVQMRQVSDPEVRKTLTPTQILRAYREKIIDASETEARLAAQGYSKEDINILMQLYKPREESEHSQGVAS